LKVILLWVLYPLIRPFYLVSLILNTLVLSLVIIAISPFDKDGRLVHYIGKFWSLLNLYLPGIRVSLKGKEKIARNGTYVVMSNHQSLLDTWVLIAKLPLQLRWVIRSGVRKMPVFGYALARMGHIYVDKRKTKDMIRGLQKAVAQTKKGASIVIFPEGTRSKDGSLLQFHRGGTQIAMRADIPILPVTINGSRFVLPKGTLALMPGKIQVVVGDVIDPRQFLANRDDTFMEAVRKAIEKNLNLEYGDLTATACVAPKEL
jgi:1-acyl-sn-glycerol-3-phosphate acyltransferase